MLEYYTQIQTQMEVLESDFCLFIIFRLEPMSLEGFLVSKDQQFIDALLGKVFEKYIMTIPEMLLPKIEQKNLGLMIDSEEFQNFKSKYFGTYYFENKLIQEKTKKSLNFLGFDLMKNILVPKRNESVDQFLLRATTVSDTLFQKKFENFLAVPSPQYFNFDHKKGEEILSSLRKLIAEEIQKRHE